MQNNLSKVNLMNQHLFWPKRSIFSTVGVYIRPKHSLGLFKGPNVNIGVLRAPTTFYNERVYIRTMKIGSEVDVKQRPKGRLCFNPTSLECCPVSNRRTDLNKCRMCCCKSVSSCAFQSSN